MSGGAQRQHRLMRAALVVLLCLTAAPAAAQTARVRVTAERATIWRPGFLTAATLVDRDTVLEVVGRRDNWLEVVVPVTNPDAPRETGFIALAQVVVISGTLPPREALARSGPMPTPGPILLDVRRPTSPAVGVRAFGDITATSFSAAETFKAVFDTTLGTFFGGGVEVRFKNVAFIQGAIRRYRATGERVFVSGGEVFPLGIDNTITLTPLDITVGGRVPIGQVAPYAGAGIGSLRIHETSDFSDEDDETRTRKPSYHVVAGVEWKGRAPVAVAGEIGFTRVPKALTGNVADAFDEHDLGGVNLRLRVLIGR
jgi:opacity protein-like surface antigen